MPERGGQPTVRLTAREKKMGYFFLFSFLGVVVVRRDVKLKLILTHGRLMASREGGHP
jgi:hypothetical protein